MGNTQGLESSGKVSSGVSTRDDSPMPLRDELEEQFAQLVVIAWCLCICQVVHVVAANLAIKANYVCTCTANNYVSMHLCCSLCCIGKYHIKEYHSIMVHI